ncbi:MAG: DUF3089 domain-containing protein [Hyphomonadaceae bacterium]
MRHCTAANWLCRPETQDACEQVATATSISEDGALTPESFTPANDPPVDCFYVYPTISRDLGGNADAKPGVEETEIIRQQAERFGADCRLFVPLYRQVTFTALRKLRAGEDVETDREMAYADVKAAWHRYLATDNSGRGFVLIGHDQGAGILTRLIAAEIDGQPVQSQLVSALLIGGPVETPEALSAGGSFRTIPLCAPGKGPGCIIAYSAFREQSPPPADSLFGSAGTTGMRAACVNPAELYGGDGTLKPFMPAGPVMFDELAPPTPWTTDNPAIETPFVALPGLLSARCVSRNGFNYLAVSLNADPLDKRTDAIGGDVVVDGNLRPLWGLHIVDMHLAMGNLVEVVARQSAEWRAAQRPGRTLPEAFHGDRH